MCFRVLLPGLTVAKAMLNGMFLGVSFEVSCSG